MNNRDAKRFISLTERIRKHEDAADELKKERAEVEARLLDNFRASGINRVSIDGRTVYLDRKVWASANAEAGGTPALASALREVGLGDLVKEAVNSQTLSGWVREFDPDGDKAPEEIVALLPASVRPTIKVSEVFRLQVRRSQ